MVEGNASAKNQNEDIEIDNIAPSGFLGFHLPFYASDLHLLLLPVAITMLYHGGLSGLMKFTLCT